MKSGRKTYRKIVARPDRMACRVRRLGNGSLRSLVLHLTKTPDESSVREQVLALAMCEVVRRFLDRGRKVL